MNENNKTCLTCGFAKNLYFYRHHDPTTIYLGGLNLVAMGLLCKVSIPPVIVTPLNTCKNWKEIEEDDKN